MSEWLDASLVAEVRKTLLDDPGPVTTAAVAEAVRRTGRVLGSSALLELVTRLSAQLSGAGPLQSVLEVPDTTDVFVNGPREIFADTGSGPELLDLSLGSEEEVRSLAVRLAALGGRRLDDSSPFVDVRLPDGVRMNAIVPPISGDHTSISFRVPKRSGFSFAQLQDDGFIPGELGEILTEAVCSRANILISGGTGTGKTVLLGALLGLVESGQRLVIVEDSRELIVAHSHIVQLAARQANVEGGGEVTLTDLVRNALRMRPDRLVVGECRGAEVRDMLTALNTGHEGGCATIHANTADAVPSRVAALGALANMSPQAVFSQFSTAIDLVIHLRRVGPDRGITELAIPTRVSAEGVVMEPVWGRASPQAEGTFNRRALARFEAVLEQKAA
ncbi:MULTISPECIES: TadA family conjugal transfer-associated ATPase [unclassified Brevibacterium]|uniref:TadA family conjugal transfer-associated ATPase n=1 Tax=unclassified Brevibacterium TaxID=2614124 RepID=UPI001E42D86D|nr:MULTISPECIES: TadA family conjugal transfer-associated ATPase [unclassified Brevibacterium]MCD1287271.1 secretion system protein E [Brevibacterium sp. CCUG 69071]MDK8436475.1 TadA family conjugal transfer-associated ATPase [Brevibacterium sp. H-BE7]